MNEVVIGGGDTINEIFEDEREFLDEDCGVGREGKGPVVGCG